MSMKNSNDTIGNRTRYLPACSAAHTKFDHWLYITKQFKTFLQASFIRVQTTRKCKYRQILEVLLQAVVSTLMVVLIQTRINIYLCTQLNQTVNFVSAIKTQLKILTSSKTIESSTSSFDVIFTNTTKIATLQYVVNKDIRKL